MARTDTLKNFLNILMSVNIKDVYISMNPIVKLNKK